MPHEPAAPAAEGASWAFVTPSYAGDYERCLLLCRSMDEFLDGDWHHYVIVDKPHFEMFKHLESNRRSVWLTDDVVPVKMKLIFHMPFLGGRSVWWSRETGLSIGWHMQQMVKIGMAHLVKQDGLVYVDSDVFFLRPFHTREMSHDGRLRFYKGPPRKKLDAIGNAKLTKASVKMLGLPEDGAYFGYIDNVVTWSRAEVISMCDYLGKRYGGHWSRAFRNRIQLSEYMLYGLYADEIDKTSSERLYDEHVQLCRTIWGADGLTGTNIADFCQNLRPGQVAIGMQSFLNVDMKLLQEQFEIALARFGKGATPRKTSA